MRTSRLKNIIILTLALVNLFLLGTLGVRQMQVYSSRRQTTEELVTLFAADGVTLDPAAVQFDDPPSALILTRSTAAEEVMAASLLGPDLTVSDEGGGIFLYTSETGQAAFRASGGFEITGQLGDSPAALCQKFCRDYGYSVPERWFDDSGSGAVTAAQYYRGYPVISCFVTFVAENGQLRSVSGTFLPDDSSATPAPTVTSVSAVTALTSFLDARRVSGAVVSEVTALYPSYEFLTTATAPMALSPAWCVVTDAGTYYVNYSANGMTFS